MVVGGGFDLLKFVLKEVLKVEEKIGNDDEEGDDDVEAECKVEFKFVVKLEIVEGAEVMIMGEEDEDILFEVYV